MGVPCASHTDHSLPSSPCEPNGRRSVHVGGRGGSSDELLRELVASAYESHVQEASTDGSHHSVKSEIHFP